MNVVPKISIYSIKDFFFKLFLAHMVSGTSRGQYEFHT
jgi:hypothetical protein